jgi:hypothetical protein
MADDLLIKINADAKNVTKAFDDIRDQTSDLEGSLKNVAVVSGIAFAALSAEIFLSVKAFEEAERASVQLNNALQNQGIYTKELEDQYKSFADAVQAKTGIDNDAIIQAQAVAQTFLGQTKITEDLTFAIADLSASMGGNLDGAAEKIARTIGTSTNAFAKQGLVIREGATEAERMATVLDFVRQKAGGLAEEFNKADGYTKALATSFGNFQEAIGSRFAPAFAAARQIAISFFDAISQSETLKQIAAILLTVGVVITGLVTGITVLVPAFLALSAAATAAGLSMSAAFLGIPLAIAAVVAAITFLALNWNTIWAGIVATTKGAITLMAELFGGLGKVLSGAFNLDLSTLKAGLAEIKGSFGKSKDAAVTSFRETTKEQEKELQTQNADKEKAAAKAAAIEAQHQANLRNIRKAEIDLLKLQNQNASAETIDLKTKEIAALKALDQGFTGDQLAAHQERYNLIKEQQEIQNAEDLERKASFAQVQADIAAENAALGIENTAVLTEAKLAELQASSATELSIERQLQEEKLRLKIEANNKFLLEQKKYGTTAATLSKILGSEEVQGAKSAAGELVQLQQSKNSTLKSIGKVAAVAQITIGTAESALNIYKGFSTIPIIGPALGVAGAAAAVAFGAERISQVTAAADGGLITGGIPGRDSVPALLEPGELVVPKRNFNDVVGAVGGGGGSDSEMIALLQSIDSKVSGGTTTIINGDVQADDSYIDSLVRKISDAIEFRNAQITGVTT